MFYMVYRDFMKFCPQCGGQFAKHPSTIQSRTFACGRCGCSFANDGAIREQIDKEIYRHRGPSPVETSYEAAVAWLGDSLAAWQNAAETARPFCGVDWYDPDMHAVNEAFRQAKEVGHVDEPAVVRACRNCQNWMVHEVRKGDLYDGTGTCNATSDNGPLKPVAKNGGHATLTTWHWFSCYYFQPRKDETGENCEREPNNT